jgi:hypothetical protein
MNNLQSLRIARRLLAVVATVLFASAALATDEPPRRPTPRRGTLADYARHVSLKASAVVDGSGEITITSSNLSEIAERGRLTRGAVEAHRTVSSPGSPDANRDHWRERYFKQRRVVTALENKRARLAAEIDRLESGRLTAAIMARIDRAEVELRLLEREVRDAKTELGRIVRDARRHGAEPGWFR